MLRIAGKVICGLTLMSALTAVSPLAATHAAWAQSDANDDQAVEAGEIAAEGQQDIAVDYPTSSNPTSFGDWAVRCTGEEGAATACEAYQTLFVAENQQRILHVAVGSRGDDEAPVAVIIVPLGVSLPAGLTLRIDNSWPIEFEFGSCQADGCRAGLTLESSMLSALQAGTGLEVELTETSGRQIIIPMSLVGFTEAYTASQDLS